MPNGNCGVSTKVTHFTTQRWEKLLPPLLLLLLPPPLLLLPLPLPVWGCSGFPCSTAESIPRRYTRLLPWTQESLGSSVGKQIFYLFCPETVGKGVIMERIAHQTCLKWTVNLSSFEGGLDLWLANVLYSGDYCLICTPNTFWGAIHKKANLDVCQAFFVFCFLNARKHLATPSISLKYCRYFKAPHKMTGRAFSKYFLPKARKPYPRSFRGI